MPRRPLAPRAPNAGRAGGGLNELPPRFDLAEAQRLVSALGRPEQVGRTARWAYAFLACCDAHREAEATEARYATLPRHVVACPTPGCGYRLERPATKGRPPKCPDCGAWTRVVAAVTICVDNGGKPW